MRALAVSVESYAILHLANLLCHARRALALDQKYGHEVGASNLTLWGSL